MDLLIGTTNAGKLREYAALLAKVPARLVSLRDVGLAAMDVEETADTFEGNAVQKAIAYARASGLYTLGDDTGLAVDALNGRPGVQSHRYAGPDADDRARYEKLLREMANVADARRAARFICVVALVDPRTLTPVTVTGTVEGRIAREPDLSGGGFGYDPVFIPNGSQVAWSAIPLAEKNRISHRGAAIRQLVPVLQQLAQRQQ
jgi:XTP/dITP diphosphohydrolase